MAEIIWNKRAGRQFEKIQDYLIGEFGEKMTEEFTNKVFYFLDLLAKYPDLGTVENKDSNIRGFVIHKYTTIFYKTVEDKIYLLSMFDNRQTLKKRKL